MSCEASETIDTQIATVAAGPARVSSDAGSVEAHKLPDLIAASNHLASKCAASRPHLGLRFVKLKPPGAV